MNREKYVMVGSLIVLALMVYWSWRVFPDLREIGVQRKGGLSPHGSLSSEEVLRVTELSDSAERNPFRWPGEKFVPPPPPSGGDDTGGGKIPPPPIVEPTVYKLPIAYVGTVKVQRPHEPRRAIFEDKDSGEYVRLAKDQHYRGVTVVEVKANRVMLRNENGRIFSFQQ